MNYQEALDYIHGTYKFGQKLGLENISRLMGYLGDPQKDLKFVHIAGTNGKGSTSTMLSYILQDCGYKTGLYISPFLEEFTERIQINNTPIDRQDLADATQTVKTAIEKLVDAGNPHPTEFEVVTAIALVYFWSQKVDIIVLEVGMGGRLDATNVIPTAEAAAIVSISFDHMLYLGNTIREIAHEKAGIIKQNYEVSVYCLNSDEIVEEINKTAKEMNAVVHRNHAKDIELMSSSIDGQHLKYLKKDSVLGIDEFDLRLLGEHQKYNVLNVLNILEILKKKGWNITPQAIRSGLKRVVFTGRFEIMNRNPIIVIDGGHNIEGITSFVTNVKKYFEGKKVNLFYGMLNDKQVDESLALLTTVAKEIYTLTPNDARAIPAEEMTAYIKEHYPNIPAHALKHFGEIGDYLDFSKTDEIFAFTGSLYMIGEARTILSGLIAKHAK
ncbi:MAG: folylpolyglutamate synthase/dihydrofolate synthase family protein [Anaerofustis sp.]